MKRFICMLLACLLLLPAALADSPFLVEDGPLVTIDEENGLWKYESPELTITITRKQDDTPLTWFETEVIASPEQPLHTAISSGKKRPGRALVNPLSLAKEQGAVLAISDDFCGYRLRRELTAGIIIREGQVLSSKTFSRNKWRTWPNLDTLAVFPDGSMKTFPCDEMTAEEYLALGCTNVFAFGPVLVSGGELNPLVLEEDYYAYNEPRMAIGMVEPYRYIILTVKGRTKDSLGVKPDWMARKMHELGCVEALNLDGGGTAVLIFMGKTINRTEKNLRSINSLITFGQVDQYPDE